MPTFDMNETGPRTPKGEKELRKMAKYESQHIPLDVARLRTQLDKKPLKKHIKNNSPLYPCELRSYGHLQEEYFLESIRRTGAKTVFCPIDECPYKNQKSLQWQNENHYFCKSHGYVKKPGKIQGPFRTREGTIVELASESK